MEVHLTPDQEAELSKLATRTGRNAEELAREVRGLYLAHEARFCDTRAALSGAEMKFRSDTPENEFLCRALFTGCFRLQPTVERVGDIHGRTYKHILPYLWLNAKISGFTVRL